MCLSMGLAACGTTGSLTPANTSSFASATQTATPTASASTASANIKRPTSAPKPTARQSPHVVKTTHRPVPRKAAPPATTAPPPAATTAGCYPVSNAGTCYEPGEFCRNSDHGVTGRAGDGEAITCADNNGWRWEPA
jgi:hypothetical protein